MESGARLDPKTKQASKEDRAKNDMPCAESANRRPSVDLKHNEEPRVETFQQSDFPVTQSMGQLGCCQIGVVCQTGPRYTL